MTELQVVLELLKAVCTVNVEAPLNLVLSAQRTCQHRMLECMQQPLPGFTEIRPIKVIGVEEYKSCLKRKKS